MTPATIPIVDDASICDALADYLQPAPLRVRTAQVSAAMDRVLADTTVDVLLLNRMMPGGDCLSVCRRLGGCGPTVLMLSAKGETVDRIAGLELGADD